MWISYTVIGNERRPSENPPHSERTSVLYNTTDTTLLSPISASNFFFRVELCHVLSLAGYTLVQVMHLFLFLVISLIIGVEQRR